MKITMKLCPDLNKLDSVEPAVVETKEDGIQILCIDEMMRNLIRKDYLLLGSSFEERVQKLKECKEKGEIFFSLYAPMVRFELVEDTLVEQYYDGKKEFENLFKEEFQIEDFEISGVKRWAYYCLSRLKIDIDVSEWAVKNYIRDYIYLNDATYKLQEANMYKYEIEKDDFIYRGDTMTSYGNFIRKYFMQIDGMKRIGKNGCAKKILNGEFVQEDISELAYLSHTKGNLIPVPLKFNVERSGSFANCDYWDLVMYAIYMWCRTQDDDYIYKLLNRYNKNEHIKESLENFKYWMKMFDNSWEKFVVGNHLEAFVDSGNEGWKPIEFWEKHFSNNRKLEDLSTDEFLRAVKLINECIKKRNEKIIHNKL